MLAVHLIAPYAKIVISATPADSEITDDPASNVAPPEMMHALEYISANHIANAISISDGTGEDTYAFGTAQIHANDPGPLAAAAAGIPVTNATGDCGVVQNLAVANAQCGNTSAGPETATWDDNPWVTAVGGTVPNVSKTDGSKLGPDPIWHEGGIFSEGAGLSDVVSGNNSVIDPNTGNVLVPGFTAAPGFDVASGWGTVDAAKFVPALVAATRASSLARSARIEAGRELSGLTRAIRLSAGSGGTTAVTSTGFLPRHPVKLAVDGTVITTLTAGDQGTVSYTLNPAALGLSHGHHVLTLQGMLITTTASFRS